MDQAESGPSPGQPGPGQPGSAQPDRAGRPSRTPPEVAAGGGADVPEPASSGDPFGAKTTPQRSYERLAVTAWHRPNYHAVWTAVIRRFPVNFDRLTAAYGERCVALRRQLPAQWNADFAGGFRDGNCRSRRALFDRGNTQFARATGVAADSRLES